MIERYNGGDFTGEGIPMKKIVEFSKDALRHPDTTGWISANPKQLGFFLRNYIQ